MTRITDPTLGALCRCGHERVAHSGAREDDFACLVADCDCGGFTAVKSRKYHNEPITADGRRFDSKAEAQRAVELQLLERAGEIANLDYQPRYRLHVDGIVIGVYVGDFWYREGDQIVVEDVKGVRTPIYRWKKKHMMAEYGIEIREIQA